MTPYELETKVIKTITDCASFAERDLYAIVRDQLNMTSDILCIDYFEVGESQRNQGFGTKILRDFCFQNRNQYVIFLVAGIPNRESDLELTDEELKETLRKLERFYRSLGFVNVNSHIGGYASKIPMLLDDTVGHEVVSYLQSLDRGVV